MSGVDNHFMEYMSKAMVQAVVASAGMFYDEPRPDHGIDCTVTAPTKILGSLSPGSVHFTAQIKSTTDHSRDEGNIIYDMKADAFNRFVEIRESRLLPHVLVLVLLPKDTTEWALIREDDILLRRCCYWHKISDDPTDKTSSIRIRIPRTQLLTPESVREILADARSGVGQ